MQWSSIGFPIQVAVRKPYFRTSIVRFESQCAGVPRFCSPIASKNPVIKCNPQHQRSNIARVQLHCALKVSRGFFPAPLTPLDGTGPCEYPRIVRQRLAGNFQFSQSTVVIVVGPIKIPPTREMRFTGVRTKARGSLKGCFCQRHPRRCMVEAIEIKRVMSEGELVIRIEKRWIARDGMG